VLRIDGRRTDTRIGLIASVQGRLCQIAKQLGVPVQEFFPEPEAIVSTPQHGGDIQRDILRFLCGPLSLRLYKALCCVADKATKNAIVKIAEKLGRAPLTPAGSALR
jgi:hypothetical protein